VIDPVQTSESARESTARGSGAHVLRGGVWSLVSGVLPQLFVLVISIAAARFLGPDAMGRQSYIAFVSLAALTALSTGFAVALLRFVAEALGRGDAAAARGLARWIWRVGLVAAAVGFAALAVPAALGSEPQLAWVLAGLVAAGGILQSVPNAVLLGAQRWREATIVGVITTGVAVPGIVVVLALGGGISGIFAVEAATVAVNVVWTGWLAQRELRTMGTERALDPELRSRAARFAAVTTLGAVLTLVVWRRSEFFFLARFSSDAEIAIYSIAFAAATAIALLPERLATVMSPAFATLFGAGQTERLTSAFARSLRLLIIGALPLCALAAGAGPLAIEVIYGGAYSGSAPVLLILLVAVPLIPLFNVGGAVMAGVGDARAPLFVGAAAAVVNVALALALVPPFDAVGAGLANAGAQIVASVLMLALARRHPEIRRLQWRPGMITRSAIVSLLVYLATWAVASALGGPGGLLAAVLTGLVALVLLGGALKPLSGDDGLWLRERVPARLGRIVARLSQRA
jgi:O-antigen/teichoic acid export membrane protein